ncbi:exportin-6-A-like [Oppia nitens]|uniref:exportin-6-A-like n=1 Tax=Oppia nitens TaxID=1686743 RepID=UPI0023DC6AD5|nr:exportin-6-A-like [Oppia nitens]
MASAECLRSLEVLLNEFFHESTTNDRKRQIEVILNEFSKQDNCWQQCLQYLSQTDNEYTLMYCLSVLENLIVIKWHSFGAEKSGRRHSIWNYLLSSNHSTPQYVRNKAAKLLVTIARIDWPNSYPDYMQNVLDLMQSKQNTSLALLLLNITIEEFSQTRDDVSAQRKCELNKLLVSEIPHILHSLTNLMEQIIDKHCNFLTATPPPSPSQSPNSESNPTISKDVLCNAFELSLRRGLLQTIPDMDSESIQISSQVLICLSQLFAFMPLNLCYQISHSTLAAVFVFATFGCNNSVVISCHKLSSTQLAILAMNCINELMAKCSTNTETNEFIFNMFQNTFHLLRKLTKINDINNHSNGSPFDNLDEEYIYKFTEFMRLFISGHLPRFEKMSTFPIMEFLGLLFEYTFKQTNCETFVLAIELWNIFIDFLNVKVKQQNDSKQVNQIVSHYKEPIVSLLMHLNRKIQFKYNQRDLVKLDNKCLDDDSLTEWQRYLHTCIELMANIADMYPLETYEIVSQLHNENLQSFFGLEHCLQTNANNETIGLKLSEADICRLQCTLRDLSTSLKLVGRLADHFTSDNFNRWFVSTKSLIEKLIQALILFNKNKFHKQKHLSIEFIDVCAQFMATIKAYRHWLQKFCNDEQSNNDRLGIISAIVENCIQIICDNRGNDSQMCHSAGHLFYSVATTVRPVFLLSLECVQMLFTRVCSHVKCHNPCNDFETNGIPGITIEDEKLLCRSISNMLLLPWLNMNNDSSQNWESRTLYHDMFIEAIVEPFSIAFKCLQMPTNGSLLHQLNETQLCHSLTLLCDIMDNHKESPTRTKQLLFKSIQSSLESFINLFPALIGNPFIAEKCLNLLILVFDVLRIQISFQFVEKTIQLMLKLFSSHRLSGTACDPFLTKVIPKFLKMLIFIVQQPGTVFKSLIPGMISFAFDQICPTIASADCPKLKRYLYEFLFQLLLNNWKYFYPNNSITSNAFNLSTNQQKPEVLQNGEAFVHIMNIFAQSFLENDITIFKHNLDALELLNTRLKLYQKEIFRQTMIKTFLSIFIQTLVDKSLNLLQDDIYIIVYNMASVDFNHFFNQFIPQYLYNCQTLTDIQRNSLATKYLDPNSKDFPTFVNNLNIFLNDLRYFKNVSSIVCNS